MLLILASWIPSTFSFSLRIIRECDRPNSWAFWKSLMIVCMVLAGNNNFPCNLRYRRTRFCKWRVSSTANRPSGSLSSTTEVSEHGWLRRVLGSAGSDTPNEVWSRYLCFLEKCEAKVDADVKLQSQPLTGHLISKPSRMCDFKCLMRELKVSHVTTKLSHTF